MNSDVNDHAGVSSRKIKKRELITVKCPECGKKTRVAKVSMRKMRRVWCCGCESTFKIYNTRR